MKPTLDDIRNAAHGRWPEIHAALGVPPEYLNTRQHQPCPYCGGRDRYRYTNYKGNGGFICNQCTPTGGSGFNLLMLVFGHSFATAVNAVAAVLGLSDADTAIYRHHQPLQVHTENQPKHDRLSALLGVWGLAWPLNGYNPASLYLRSRGLPRKTIRAAANLRCAESPLFIPGKYDALLMGHFPTLLAAITLPDGSLQGLHYTYLQAGSTCFDSQEGEPVYKYHKLQMNHPRTGAPLPAKKMKARFAGSLKGAAVHLAKPDEQGRLLVAEGIETALAASALFGLPAVAALSANGMAAFQWPPECKSLFIAADNDANGTGIRAAHDLAVRAIKAGLQANIWQPPDVGEDALDVWNKPEATT